MLSIKTKLKLVELKKKLIKFYYFIMKPLGLLFDKINDYEYKKSQKRIKKKISQLTDEDVIKLVVEDIIKDLIKYSSHDIVFDYEYGWYDDDTLLTYIRKSKNKILRVWECELNYEEYEKKNNELLALLKKELSKYPEVEFMDYQKNKYCTKVLMIRLQDVNK